MIDALRLVFGIVLLLAGGHWLVVGSVTIARRLGMSTLVVGLTIVAAGTSAPELFFNVIAATAGHAEMSFGNIIGSNIANIGLVLGITAVIWPLTVHGRVVSKELPWLVIVSLFAVVVAVLWDGFGHFGGAVMLIGFGIFMFVWYRLGRREAADPLVAGLGEEAEADTVGSMGGAIALFLIGLATLLAGGNFAEVGAVGIAKSLGLTEGLIGLTIVAFATSLPELSTCVIACRKGHHDLAVGNIVGSNIFNLLLVLGLTAVITPVQVPETGVSDLLAMVVITCLLWLMARTHGYRLARYEGAVLLLCYLGYMAWSVGRELSQIGGSPPS